MKTTQSRIYDAAMRVFAERGVTQLSVSDLSEAAGLARGTIYNNLRSPDALFEEIATRLTSEMHERVSASLEGVDDPAQRLANGLRHFVRRAHQDPVWGRFITHFAFSSHLIQEMFQAPPGVDLEKGISTGRYRIEPAMSPTALSMIGGCALSAMHLVLEGHKTWRAAGSETTELILIALGLPSHEAREIARSELPDLPEPV